MTKGPGHNKLGINGHTPERESLRDLTRKWTEEALMKVIDIMRNGDSGELQLKAAECILDRAWGKPSQQIDLLRQDMQVIATLSREDLMELAPTAMALLNGGKE